MDGIKNFFKGKKAKVNFSYESTKLDGDGNLVSYSEKKHFRTKDIDFFGRTYDKPTALYFSILTATEIQVFVTCCIFVNPSNNVFNTSSPEAQMVSVFCGISDSVRRNVISKLISKGFMKRMSYSGVMVNPYFYWRGAEDKRLELIASEWTDDGDDNPIAYGINKKYQRTLDEFGIEELEGKKRKGSNKKSAIKPNTNFEQK